MMMKQSPLADRIIDALRTGELCDGEVIILPVEQSVRLRVGQRGHRVIQLGTGFLLLLI